MLLYWLQGAWRHACVKGERCEREKPSQRSAWNESVSEERARLHSLLAVKLLRGDAIHLLGEAEAAQRRGVQRARARCGRGSEGQNVSGRVATTRMLCCAPLAEALAPMAGQSMEDERLSCIAGFSSARATVR